MKKIVDMINNHCKNYGSFIKLSTLKRKWMWENRLSEEAFHKELQHCVLSGDVVLKGDHVYLKHVFLQEEYAAERLSELLALPPLPQPPLPAVLRIGDMTLTSEQRAAVQTCLSKPISLLLAPAGCGKTTVAQAIVQYSNTNDFILCSPTGKAAKNLSIRTGFDASTVHRFLGVRNIREFLDVEQLTTTRLIVIDEGTMLTADMLGGLLRAASDDCKIVIMGDRNQLPAVGSGNVVNDLVALGIPVVSLTQNHRQTICADALRFNVLSYNSIHSSWQLRADESFRMNCSEDPAQNVNALLSDYLSHYDCEESVQVLTFRCDDVLMLNRRIQEHVNPITASKKTLKTKNFVFADHDRVVIIRNDNSRDCYNGETGYLRIEDNGAYGVMLDRGDYVRWSEYDVPNHILPAYALTIHRAQGSEYDSVFMYVPWCSSCLLHRNALYTGISRAKKNLYLYGEPDAIESGLSTLPPKRASALVSKTNLFGLDNAG